MDAGSAIAVQSLHDAVAYMRMAIVLLDEAQSDIAACHLQHAIDVVEAEIPAPSTTASISFSSVRVGTGSGDEVGFLVRVRGDLVAVLVRLDDEGHGPLRGQLFLEVGFGPYAVTSAVYFRDIDTAHTWFEARAKAAYPVV